MKKLFTQFVFIAAIAFAPLSVFAVSLTLTPSATTINPGDLLTVDVEISGLANSTAPSLGAFLVEVTFDPGILTFSSESYGASLGNSLDFFETDIVTTLGAGLVSLDEISWLFDFELDALQADHFTLATLSFLGNGVGSSALGFGAVDLSDADFFANTLPVSSFNVAEVSVESPAPPPTAAVPEPSTWMLMGSGFVSLFFWRRRERAAA